MKQRRLDRAEQAAAAADAYRQARIDAEREQGQPLTTEQHRALGRAFKDQLLELGLSTTSLKGL